MKTIIAVIYFGVLTYACENHLQYGKNFCQWVGGLANFDAKRFFQGSWSLTHSTRSARVTESTICRDYKITSNENGIFKVTYGFDENKCGNHYDIHCNGTQSSVRIDEFNFDCYLHNERSEMTHSKVKAYFLGTDYETYGILYRCVTTKDHFEDNIFILFRSGKTDESYAEVLAKHYGLTMNDFISRKNATCTNSEDFHGEKKELPEDKK